MRGAAERAKLELELQLAEAEFEQSLASALRSCVSGHWGLFGHNGERWDEARKTRALILDVADRHFKRYGYTKTTIVDIASDCAMSHANVYRFFRNKADLADAVAALWLEKIVAAGSAVVARAGSARIA